MSDEGLPDVPAPDFTVRTYAIGNADGEILRSVQCLVEHSAGQAFPGEQLVEIEADVSAVTHHLVAGAAVPYTDEQTSRKRAPPSSAARWINASMSWDDPTRLDAAQFDAANAIDVAAGAARLRYITEAPGQQAVYLRKAEESRAFRAASYTGDAPPYVDGEAQAMGITPQAAADRILAIADAWDGQLSPAIERMRIWGKNAVALATTLSDVRAARDAAIQQLAAV